MSGQAHWDRVYETKASDKVSWYQPHLAVSMEMIGALDLKPAARIIDIGGGASTFVDDLLEQGSRELSVVDVSPKALQTVRERLGARARWVNFLAGDVTEIVLSRHQYDVWHDRAVFHFLTLPRQRAAYVRQVLHAVKPGGHLVMATFAPDGPEKCSGLEVARYDASGLASLFGAHGRLVDDRREVHVTPLGAEQAFTYCCLQIG